MRHRVDDRAFGSDHHVGHGGERVDPADVDRLADHAPAGRRVEVDLAGVTNQPARDALGGQPIHALLRVRPPLRQAASCGVQDHERAVDLGPLRRSPRQFLGGWRELHAHGRAVELDPRPLRHAFVVVLRKQAATLVVRQVEVRVGRERQRMPLNAPDQVDEVIVLPLAVLPVDGLQRPRLLAEDAVGLHPELVDVRVVPQARLALRLRVQGDVPALRLQLRKDGGDPQRVAKGAQPHQAERLGWLWLRIEPADAVLVGLAVHLQEAVFVVLRAHFVALLHPALAAAPRHALHGGRDVGVAEVVLVVRVAAGHADVRIVLGVRQVQDQPAAWLEHAPPLAQRSLVVFNVLQRVTGKDHVDAGIGEQVELFDITGDIRIRLDAEKTEVFVAVDADHVLGGKHLGRAAAQVEALAVKVMHQVERDLGGLLPLRAVCAPYHVSTPEISRKGRRAGGRVIPLFGAGCEPAPSPALIATRSPWPCAPQAPRRPAVRPALR